MVCERCIISFIGSRPPTERNENMNNAISTQITLNGYVMAMAKIILELTGEISGQILNNMTDSDDFDPTMLANARARVATFYKVI